MTKDDALAKLEALNQAICTAVFVIKSEQETLDRFFVEQSRMESVGPILDPTLFNNSERRATEALLSPISDAARNIIRIYDMQSARAADALQAVSPAQNTGSG